MVVRQHVNRVGAADDEQEWRQDEGSQVDRLAGQHHHADGPGDRDHDRQKGCNDVAHAAEREPQGDQHQRQGERGEDEQVVAHIVRGGLLDVCRAGVMELLGPGRRGEKRRDFGVEAEVGIAHVGHVREEHVDRRAAEIGGDQVGAKKRRRRELLLERLDLRRWNRDDRDQRRGAKGVGGRIDRIGQTDDLFDALEPGEGVGEAADLEKSVLAEDVGGAQADDANLVAAEGLAHRLVELYPGVVRRQDAGDRALDTHAQGNRPEDDRHHREERQRQTRSAQQRPRQIHGRVYNRVRRGLRGAGRGRQAAREGRLLAIQPSVAVCCRSVLAPAGGIALRPKRTKCE